MQEVKVATAYKLTTQEMTTYNGFQWEMGKVVTTSGEGDLCGPGWLHAYRDPLLGLFLNPIHANISNPRLWVVEVGSAFLDDRGLKCGYTSMKLVRQLRVPVITTEQRVRFAIACAWKHGDSQWRRWAMNWLDGTNRSAASATRAWAAARATAAAAAAWAAEAAARAAEASEVDLPRIALWAMGTDIDLSWLEVA